MYLIVYRPQQRIVASCMSLRVQARKTEWGVLPCRGGVLRDDSTSNHHGRYLLSLVIWYTLSIFEYSRRRTCLLFLHWCNT